MIFTVNFFNGKSDAECALKSIELNNEAYIAFANKEYHTSLIKYQQAIKLKTRVHGNQSYHLCISLSGKYLHNKL